MSDRPSCNESDCAGNYSGECDFYSNEGSDVCPDISNDSDSGSESTDGGND